MALSRNFSLPCSDRLLLSLTVQVSAVIMISQSAFAEVTQRGLAEMVKKAIQEESVLYDPPRVAIRDQQLHYSPGRILYPDYANKPAQPMGFPVDLQFKLELLRRFRAENKNELAFFEPYLKKMDAVVSKELVLIAMHKDGPDELLKRVTELDDQAAEILKKAIADWAAKQGVQVAEESFQAAVIPTVTIKTLPAGGTVYYLNAVDYNVYKAAGLLNEVDRWNQIPGEQMDMGGTFYFRAVWPGGKTKQTAKIVIDKEQTISLRAD